MKYVFVNPEDMQNIDPHKQYNTRVVNAEWREGTMVVELEYLGTEYSPKDPQCLFPVRDIPEYHVHPFVD